MRIRNVFLYVCILIQVAVTDDKISWKLNLKMGMILEARPQLFKRWVTLSMG